VSTPRPACAAVAALVIALCVGACGSDAGPSPSPSATAGAGAGANRPGNARRGFLQDPKVVACLKQQGVTVPTRPRGNGGPPNGQDGRRPNGPGSAQFQKLRAALQKCGVDFRGRPPNGAAPQGQGTTSTSAT
jgi:hypothetical protein